VRRKLGLAAKSEFESLERAAAIRPREIVKEGISEYFLYTVEGRDTIPTGWARRMPSFRADPVPISSYYKFERELWGDRVMRFFKFKNDKASKLGAEPLPDGAVKAFRVESDDQLYGFLGATNAKYIPVNEEAEWELGADLEVMVKPRLMAWQKNELQFDQNGNVKGWTTRETWEIEVQNSRDIDVIVDIRRNFSGDWAITTPASHEKVDAHKVKFVLPLKPRAKQTISYEVVTRNGSNASR
jgi:hypothetical protein